MSNYERPKKTYTDFLNEVLENQGFNAPSIQEKLKNYTKVIDINELKKDDHIRYFIWNNDDNKLKFRTGGFIKIINDEYFILTNKKNFNWSVQKKIQSNDGIVYRTLFFKKNYQESIQSTPINKPENLVDKNEFNLTSDESDTESESSYTDDSSSNISEESSYFIDNQYIADNLSKEQMIQLFLNSYK